MPAPTTLFEDHPIRRLYDAANDIQPGHEFAILTNLIHEEWSGVSVQISRDSAATICATT